MEKLGIEYKECHETGTIVHVAIEGKYSGHIVIADIIKQNGDNVVGYLDDDISLGDDIDISTEVDLVTEPTDEQAIR